MTLPPLYHLHPMLVHFPIALLVCGASLVIVDRLVTWRAPQALARALPWLGSTERLLIVLGTLAAWAAVATGHLAHDTAPHVPNAWEVLAEHEEYGETTAMAGTAYALWLLFAAPRIKNQLLVRGIDWVATLLILILVIRTGHLGAQLVFIYGVGQSG